MIARNFFTTVLVVTAAVSASPASGQSGSSPVESRTFHFHPGTGIERVPENCMSNLDWLLMRAPGIANAKSVDVAPRVSQSWKGSFPSTSCVAPDCLPLFIKVTDRDEPGPRTVTVKYADGRTAATTFEIVPNAGRCDSPKKQK